MDRNDLPPSRTPPIPLHAATNTSGNVKKRPKIMQQNPPNPIMKHFEYAHLPQHLQGASKHICEIAQEFDRMLPPSSEKHAGLRKLLEAKDCMVRAHLACMPVGTNQ